jgi:CHASE1-domain containing sensor protein
MYSKYITSTQASYSSQELTVNKARYQHETEKRERKDELCVLQVVGI